jgi:hypothetical protein
MFIVVVLLILRASLSKAEAWFIPTTGALRVR